MTSGYEPTSGYESDPLHSQIATEREWSTTNFSEAMPGVPTPLSWSVWHRGMEYGGQRGFVGLGALPRTRLAPELPGHLRITAIFHGRVAGNVSLFHEITSALPGTSPAAFDEQIFGMDRPDTDNTPAYRRYPVVAVRAPLTLARMPRQLRTVRVEADRLWSTATAGQIGDLENGRKVLAASAELFGRVMVPHSLNALLCSGLFQQLAALAESAGHPGLEHRLVTGSASMAEVQVADDLWDAAHGQTTLEAVLRRHGYHGPSEGELSARSWREDPGPLTRVFETYRKMAVTDSPRAKRRRLATQQREAQTTLMAGLSRAQQVKATVLIRLSRTMLTSREGGKTAFVQALDIVRHGARAMGHTLAADATLAQADDVFYFTLDELTAPALPAHARDLVEQRRQARAAHQDTRLPDLWHGQPVPLNTSDDAPEAGADITGLAAASGVVEGIARVILDPAAAEPLDPDEILVCTTTDPSWVAVMVCAAGLVIDTGGAVSHGAIIAREMGVPCVINTKNGTTRIHTGDLIRVDGDQGTVNIITAASDAPEATSITGRRTR